MEIVTGRVKVCEENVFSSYFPAFASERRIIMLIPKLLLLIKGDLILLVTLTVEKPQLDVLA